MELTDKQQQLLDYLTERMDEDGRIPTLRQAAIDLGVSHTAVAQLMNQLEKKNVLRREGYYGRTIRLYPKPLEGQELSDRSGITDHWTGYGRASHVCPTGVGRNGGGRQCGLSRR